VFEHIGLHTIAIKFSQIGKNIITMYPAKLDSVQKVREITSNR